MSVSIVQPPLSISPPLPRKRFTASEVAQMEASGIFAGQRFELIDGDLINKMGQNPPHASGIKRCMQSLMAIFGAEHLRVQMPMEASPDDQEYSLPEPDLALLAKDKPDFIRRHPKGHEMSLVVEVSDTTLRHDTGRKAQLYANAGVPEYWVLDLNARRLLVHKSLNIDSGEYGSIQSLQESESVTPSAAPENQILVSSLFP